MLKHKLAWWQRRRLQKQLRQIQDARIYRRTLALLEYDRGQPISQIAERLGICRRSVHYWIAAFALYSDPKVLCDGPRPGRPTDWTEATTCWLRELLDSSPGQWGYMAVDWTMPLLGKALARGTGQGFSRSTIWRELKRLDYVWKRPRYVLRPDPQREKKTLDSAPIGPSAGPVRDSGSG